jgi:hypothetical protein
MHHTQRSRFAVAAALILTAAAATASLAKADTVTITVPQADISGSPGSTIGWGINLESTTHYMTIANVSLLPGPSIGTFTDMLSIRYPFEVGPSPAPQSSVNEVFNQGLGTGLASFAIDGGAPPGAVAYGILYIVYNLYNFSPNYDPAFDPFDPAHTHSEGNVVEIPVSITVVEAPAVPEPSTWLSVGFGCALGLAGMYRRRRRQ